MKDPSRVRVSGPLEAFAPGFVVALDRVGYSPIGAMLQLRLMARLSRWLESEGLGAVGLTDEVVERFLVERRAAGYRDYVTARATVPLLGYLRGLGIVPPPVPRGSVTAAEVLLERYGEYLGVERGLTADTVESYVHAVRPFVAGLGGDGEPDLRGLTAAQVTAFVVARCPRQSRGAAKMTVTALRSLLGFLHVEGLIERSLVGAVPSAASWRLSGAAACARARSGPAVAGVL
jgi:integrase/recombinase XerD